MSVQGTYYSLYSSLHTIQAYTQLLGLENKKKTYGKWPVTPRNGKVIGNSYYFLKQPAIYGDGKLIPCWACCTSHPGVLSLCKPAGLRNGNMILEMANKFQEDLVINFLDIASQFWKCEVCIVMHF